MKTILVFITILLTASLAQADCGSCGVGDDVSHNKHMEKAAMKPMGSCADGLLTHYYATQEALADDNLAAAKTAAQGLVADYSGSKCADHEAECCAAVKGAGEGIINAADLAAARESFKTLSNTMISLVKAGGVAHGKTYLAHCPMAFADEGADWLQSGKEVMNPYFGHRMLHCGVVNEEIGNGNMMKAHGKKMHGDMDHHSDH